jgi:multiple sugar transport system substrate-binding protein
VGGYVLCIPANLARERVRDAVEALIAFTSPEAQKLYVQNGSRTNAALFGRRRPGSAPPVADLRGRRRMSWRDELQFWPRPPIPQISDIIDLRKECTTCCAASSRRAKARFDRPGRAEESCRKPVH